MPEIKIVTEVAGRVCALPVEIGGTVGNNQRSTVFYAKYFRLATISIEN